MERKFADINLPFKVGRASQYIAAFVTLRPGDRVVLLCRKSRGEENRSLEDQQANLLRVAKSHRLIVVAVVTEEASGYDPWYVGKAAALAERLDACAILAECPNRLKRHSLFDPTRSWSAALQPTDADWRDVQWWASGILLVTHLHPDATPGEEKQYQIRRRAKSKRGGRPRRAGATKRIRQRDQKRAVQLRGEEMSLRQIGRLLGRTHSTIQGWTS